MSFRCQRGPSTDGNQAQAQPATSSVSTSQPTQPPVGPAATGHGGPAQAAVDGMDMSGPLPACKGLGLSGHVVGPGLQATCTAAAGGASAGDVQGMSPLACRAVGNVWCTPYDMLHPGPNGPGDIRQEPFNFLPDTAQGPWRSFELMCDGLVNRPRHSEGGSSEELGPPLDRSGDIPYSILCQHAAWVRSQQRESHIGGLGVAAPQAPGSRFNRHQATGTPLYEAAADQVLSTQVQGADAYASYGGQFQPAAVRAHEQQPWGVHSGLSAMGCQLQQHKHHAHAYGPSLPGHGELQVSQSDACLLADATGMPHLLSQRVARILGTSVGHGMLDLEVPCLKHAHSTADKQAWGVACKRTKRQIRVLGEGHTLQALWDSIQDPGN